MNIYTKWLFSAGLDGWLGNDRKDSVENLQLAMERKIWNSSWFIWVDIFQWFWSLLKKKGPPFQRKRAVEVLCRVLRCKGHLILNLSKIQKKTIDSMMSINRIFFLYSFFKWFLQSAVGGGLFVASFFFYAGKNTPKSRCFFSSGGGNFPLPWTMLAVQQIEVLGGGKELTSWFPTETKDANQKTIGFFTWKWTQICMRDSRHHAKKEVLSIISPNWKYK